MKGSFRKFWEEWSTTSSAVEFKRIKCSFVKIKRRAVKARLRFITCLFEALNGYDILCLRAFLTLGHSERDLLPFNQSFETGTADRAEVGEHIGTAGALDEAEAFRFVEPLDGTGNCIGHNRNPVEICFQPVKAEFVLEKQKELIFGKLVANFETNLKTTGRELRVMQRNGVGQSDLLQAVGHGIEVSRRSQASYFREQVSTWRERDHNYANGRGVRLFQHRLM